MRSGFYGNGEVRQNDARDFFIFSRMPPPHSRNPRTHSCTSDFSIKFSEDLIKCHLSAAITL